MADLQTVEDTFGDVYAGADYLASSFEHLVQGPGSKSFMFKVHDDLVAFASTIIVDNGQTLIVFAARVKDGYQNHGVFTRVRKMICGHFSDRTLYPNLCRQMVTVADSKIGQHKMTKSGWRKVCRKHNSRVAFSISSLSNLTVPKTPCYQVTTLKEDDLKNLFSSPYTQWLHLFPKKRIILAWEVYSVMPENVHNILTGRLKTVFYGTKASLSTSQPQKTDAKFSLLTAGSYYTCALGICYFVDVCGAADNSEELGDHLITHLQRVKSVTKGIAGKVIFQVFAQEKLEEVVHNATRQLETFLIAQDHLISPEGMVLWEVGFNAT